MHAQCAPRFASETIEGSVTIRCPVETVFDFYSDFRNLPRFLLDVIRVGLIGDYSSSWVIKSPFGFDVHWPVHITDIRANASIAYEMESFVAPIRWVVTFAPIDNGAATIVREQMEVPGGEVAEIVFGAIGKPPAREVRANLIRLKALLETVHTTGDCVVDHPLGTARPERSNPHLAKHPAAARTH